MKRKLWQAVVLWCAAVTAADAAVAQDSYVYSATLLGGVGGAFDAEPDSGLSNSTFQLGFSMLIDTRTYIGLRAGRLSFKDQGIDDLVEAELEYLTVAGEYRFRQSWYDYGLFFGIGDFQLDGHRLDGHRETENVFGGTLGLTGDFRINRWLSVVGEVVVHYALFDDAKVFGQALGGVAFHF